MTNKFKLTGAAETEMLASLPLTGDEENKEEDGRMVALVVTIDAELLRRIENSGHSDFVTDPTAFAEEASTENEPGKLTISEFRPNGAWDSGHSGIYN